MEGNVLTDMSSVLANSVQKININGMVPKVPQPMPICKIIIPKISMRKLCKDHKISYSLTVRDYDLNVSDGSDSEDYSDDNLEISLNYFSETLPSFKNPKKKKKNQRVTHYLTNKEKKRKFPEELVTNNKRHKTSQNTNKFAQEFPKTHSQKPQQKTKVVAKTVINGKPHLKVSEIQKPNNQSINNSKKKPKPRPPTVRPMRADANKIITFLGSQFRYGDLFDDYCECVNNCELDELSMAFHMMTTLSEEELPKDLKIATVGRTADMLSSDEDKSDPNLEDVMPLPEDIYRLAMEEDFDPLIDNTVKEFVMNTSANQNVIRSQPSCTVVSSGTQISDTNTINEDLPVLNESEVLKEISDFNGLT